MADKEFAKKVSRFLKSADKVFGELTELVEAASEIKHEIKQKFGKLEDENNEAES